MVRLTGVLALFTYVLVATSYAGFLCFGADGHVGFEQLRDEHPIVRDSAAVGASPARGMALIARDASPAAPHGPCFDVAIDAGSAWRAGTTPDSARFPLPPAPLLTAAALVVPRRVAHLPESVVTHQAPADSPVLTSLGSTVLRI